MLSAAVQTIDVTLSRFAPVLDAESGNPGKVISISGDENAASPEGGGGDDQVGVPVRVTARVPADPQVCRFDEDVVRDGIDDRVLTECVEFLKLRCGVLRLQTPHDFITGHRRNRELLVLRQIVRRFGDNIRVLLFENLRENVRIEKRERHDQATGKDMSLRLRMTVSASAISSSVRPSYTLHQSGSVGTVFPACSSVVDAEGSGVVVSPRLMIWMMIC